MLRLLITLLIYIASVSAFSQKADYAKMSSLVRRMAMEYKVNEDKAKGFQTQNAKEISLMAFVRTNDLPVLEAHGCKVFASLDDIHVAQIPFRSLASLSLSENILRIEAGESCHLQLDTTRIITHQDKVCLAQKDGYNLSFAGYTGNGVVVGVEDISFDLTHPTFRSTDGQRYRIKALWDQLAKKEEESQSLPVGKEFVSEDDILAYQHTLDYELNYHGTHTAGIAAGSGWNGTATSPYIGLAPEADICLVCNVCGNNSRLVSEEDKPLYTDATDFLGFKYIFDYAEKQGKPCVINFSEGRHEDFYGETMFYEAVEKLLGPGRIICASAGNEGNAKSYLCKKPSQKRVSSFIHVWSKKSNIFMRSNDRFTLSLEFFLDGADNIRKSYSFDDVFKAKDDMLNDTLSVRDRQYAITYCIYPSGFNKDDWGIEFYLSRLDGGNIGYDIPIMLTLEGEGVDIEAFSYSGELWEKKDLCPESVSAELGHNIVFPSSSKNVISVGSSSYPRTLKTYKGKDIAFTYQSDYNRASFSCIGPTLQGFIKPDVLAPGENIVSSMNSFYVEKYPTSLQVSKDVERFKVGGRTYSWNADSGTSMSSPVVAGIIALWLQACPTLTPQQVMDVISHTSRKHEGIDYPNTYLGWGEIDAKAGLDYVLSTYTGIKDLTICPDNSHSDFGSPLYYYDLHGRKTTTISGKRGLFFAVDAFGRVRKAIK